MLQRRFRPWRAGPAFSSCGPTLVTVTVQADSIQLDAVTDDTGTWRVEGVPGPPCAPRLMLNVDF